MRTIKNISELSKLILKIPVSLVRFRSSAPFFCLHSTSPSERPQLVKIPTPEDDLPDLSRPRSKEKIIQQKKQTPGLTVCCFET